MRVVIDKKYRWQRSGNEDLKYWYIGSEKDVEKFVSLLNNMHSDDAPSIKPIVLEVGEVFVYPPEPA